MSSDRSNPVVDCSSLLARPPTAGIRQTWIVPDRFDEKAIHRSSGDQAAAYLCDGDVSADARRGS